MKVQMNRSTKNGKDWNLQTGNTRVGDGYVGSVSNFAHNVSDEKILREYLRDYSLDLEEGDSGRWMEITIHARPGTLEYGKTFYVQPHAGGKWATVIEQVPVGEYRTDGYRY